VGNGAVGGGAYVRAVDQPQPEAGPAADEQLVRWRAPGWASRSVVEEAGVQHSLQGRRCTALDDVDGEREVIPRLMQYDGLVVEPGGVFGVNREQPIIVCDGTRLTVDQAIELGRALVDLAEAVLADSW
jgi:hypothetical protein